MWSACQAPTLPIYTSKPCTMQRPEQRTPVMTAMSSISIRLAGGVNKKMGVRGNPESKNTWLWDSGTECNDSDDCFQRFFDAYNYEYFEPIKTGTGDSAWAHPAVRSTRDPWLDLSTSGVKWATWGFHVPETGRYVVEAYMPAEAANRTRSANYRVYRYQNGNLVKDLASSVDQSSVNNDWLPLGTHTFDANSPALVILDQSSWRQHR